MIQLADAGPDPEAVVIKFVNTLLAVATVPRAVGLEQLALLAETLFRDGWGPGIGASVGELQAEGF